MTRRYPLESLRLARQREKEESARAASSAADARRLAEQVLSRARAHRDGVAEELRAGLATESARVEGGSARASDLVQAEHHRGEAERRVRSTELAVERAAERATVARQSEDTARQELSQAHGAERAVDEHRARFVAERAEGAERRAEDDAADAWNAGRQRSAQQRAGKPPAE